MLWHKPEAYGYYWVGIRKWHRTPADWTAPCQVDRGKNGKFLYHQPCNSGWWYFYAACCCRYSLYSIGVIQLSRFYFQAWNITIIIFIKIIKANQTACLKIIKSCSINNDNNINNNIVYTLIFESYHSIFLLSSSYGFSQILSGLAIRRALLYAISKVKQVCPKYWIPASFLLTTNAKSGIFSFIRHIGIKSCIFLYNTVERLFYNLHLSFVWPF